MIYTLTYTPMSPFLAVLLAIVIASSQQEDTTHAIQREWLCRLPTQLLVVGLLTRSVTSLPFQLTCLDVSIDLAVMHLSLTTTYMLVVQITAVCNN